MLHIQINIDPTTGKISNIYKILGSVKEHLPIEDFIEIPLIATFLYCKVINYPYKIILTDERMETVQGAAGVQNSMNTICRISQLLSLENDVTEFQEPFLSIEGEEYYICAPSFYLISEYLYNIYTTGDPYLPPSPTMLIESFEPGLGFSTISEDPEGRSYIFIPFDMLKLISRERINGEYLSRDFSDYEDLLNIEQLLFYPLLFRRVSGGYIAKNPDNFGYKLHSETFYNPLGETSFIAGGDGAYPQEVVSPYAWDKRRSNLIDAHYYTRMNSFYPETDLGGYGTADNLYYSAMKLIPVTEKTPHISCEDVNIYWG